jgi:anti-sigma regulatory factor (Ser/Thr protein kinase)
MTSQTKTFPATSAGARAARIFATEVLSAHDGLAADAALVVSELAANAVLHASTPFAVTIRCTDDVVRIEVADQDPSHPQVKDHGTAAPTGRGLRIVEQLAGAWGGEPATTGKTVWAELQLLGQGVG